MSPIGSIVNQLEAPVCWLLWTPYQIFCKGNPAIKSVQDLLPSTEHNNAIFIFLTQICLEQIWT